MSRVEGSLEVSRLLIDLDSIFDTRLSILNSLGEETLKKAIDAKYFDRERDEFPGVSFEDFQKLYQARNKTTLKETVITPMVFFVEQFVNKTLENITSSPFHMKPAIVINSYPYVLTPGEDAEIVNAVRAVVDGKADIGIVSLSPAQLTVKYIKEYYSVVVMYRYDVWIQAQANLNNFDKLTCPEVTFIGPRLKFVKNDIEGPDDPFDKTEQVMAPMIGLLLFPVRDFSAVAP